MDCNRDEAVRAKEIAEKKLQEGDTEGANKFALKAKSVFPTLEGLSRFLEVINVYVAYQKKINGEPDYYGILDVDPFADEDVLKKQYRRMALTLHPDKNRSVGAEEAFKMLSEAWRLLSNKDTRNDYNMKLNIKPSNQSSNVSSTSAWPSTAAASTQHVPTRPWPAGAATSQQNTSAPAHQSDQFPSQQRTPAASAFGGSLHNPGRSMPSPRVPIFPTQGTYGTPIQTSPSTMGFNSVPSTQKQQPGPSRRYQKSPPPKSAHGPSQASSRYSSQLRPESFWTSCSGCRLHYEYQKIYLRKNLMCPRCQRPFLAIAIPAPKGKIRSFQRESFPRPQQYTPAPDTGASTEHLKRMREEAVNTEVKREAQTHGSNTASENVETAQNAAPSSLAKEKQVKRRRAGNSNDGTQETARSRPGEKKNSENPGGVAGQKNARELCRQLNAKQMHNLMIRKAKRDIVNKLKEQESDNNVDAVDSRSQKKRSDLKNSLQEMDDLEAIPEETKAMTVPDANFHNFDEDRVEDSFSENEVWAAYDNDDGMPRYYALVHRVISKEPFKVQISWLNSRSTSEFGCIDWVDSGFTKSAGGFRPAKPVIINRLNSFSHLVKWNKGPRGVYLIFPSKGDVWALYKNWSPDWNEDTENEVKHKYDVVVVLQDYHEDTGVLVAPLTKVAGFTSVFSQLFNQEAGWSIPREEMFRFSHQVPFFQLNGLEDKNAPEGSYELDPAALPLDLLRVITDEETSFRHPGLLSESEVGAEHDKPVRIYSRRKKGIIKEQSGDPSES